YQKLEQVFPEQGLAECYQARYGMRYQCASPKAGKLWEVFSKECQRLGLLCNMRHIVSAATRPYTDRQLTFF
ncbi:MAG: radical SAM protein, partial [Lawsonibacter sp.]|nr:radical SAM protein [Lawsonibacter sp.]